MEKVDTLVVDKTGTLTEGKPRVAAVVALPGFTEDEVLRLAASLERGSEHPLAAAIVAGAEARELTLASAEGFESITGKGVKGTIEGRAVALGNMSLFERSRRRHERACGAGRETPIRGADRHVPRGRWQGRRSDRRGRSGEEPQRRRR